MHTLYLVCCVLCPQVFYQYEEPLMSPTLFPTYKKVRGCAESVYPPLPVLCDVATCAYMMYVSCMPVCVCVWVPPDARYRTAAACG